MQKLQRKLEIEIKNIELLILDVDGVLTDNRMIYVNDDGEAKSFSAGDGFAIKATSNRALRYAVISARHSDVTERRCREIGIHDVFTKWNKLEALEDLMKKYGLTLSQVGCVGNDIPDALIMEKVGLAVCPADAEEEMFKFAHYQTGRAGGKGCCREVIKFILEAKGLDLMQIYRDGLADNKAR